MRNKYKLSVLFLGLLLGIIKPMIAQEDWKSLVSLDSLNTSGNTSATFKTTRLINGQSVETVKKHTLDFRVAHRFGN